MNSVDKIYEKHNYLALSNNIYVILFPQASYALIDTCERPENF